MRRATQLLGPVVPAIVSTSIGRTLLLSQLIGKPAHMPATVAAATVASVAQSPCFNPQLEGAAGTRFTGGQSLPVPVTVARGERDVLLLPWQSRQPDQLPTSTSWRYLPGCGHVPMYDNPEAVVRVLLDGSAVNAGVYAPA